MRDQDRLDAEVQEVLLRAIAEWRGEGVSAEDVMDLCTRVDGADEDDVVDHLLLLEGMELVQRVNLPGPRPLHFGLLRKGVLALRDEQLPVADRETARLYREALIDPGEWRLLHDLQNEEERTGWLQDFDRDPDTVREEIARLQEAMPVHDHSRLVDRLQALSDPQWRSDRTDCS